MKDIIIEAEKIEDFMVWEHGDKTIDILIILGYDHDLRIECSSYQELEKLLHFLTRLCDILKLHIQFYGQTVEKEESHEKDH